MFMWEKIGNKLKKCGRVIRLQYPSAPSGEGGGCLGVTVLD